jgi:molybdenum cofactor guanylyltransferase
MHRNGLTLTAALFAGGESHRMGRDKAQVTFVGEPLWSRQLKILGELKPEEILVSARVRPAWCAPDIEAVLDRQPSSGPLSGLVALLKQTQTTHLLVVAIDLPMMTATHLLSLWKTAKQGMGVIPQNGGVYEPMCAIYSAETAAIAELNLANKEFSLQSLAEKLSQQHRAHSYRLTNLEQPLYCNVNTPEDLACLDWNVSR